MCPSHTAVIVVIRGISVTIALQPRLEPNPTGPYRSIIASGLLGRSGLRSAATSRKELRWVPVAEGKKSESLNRLLVFSAENEDRLPDDRNLRRTLLIQTALPARHLTIEAQPPPNIGQIG